MPSATPSSAPMRIPAWKRLGLKLKSAQEAPAESAQQDAHDTPKRKRLDEAEDTLYPKKQKSHKSPQHLPVADQVTPNLVRKKSVTFTPETKVEDGDTIKQLYNAWAAEQNIQDLSAPVFKTPEPSKVEENFDNALDEKERRTKRVQKSNSASLTLIRDDEGDEEEEAEIGKSITATRHYL